MKLKSVRSIAKLFLTSVILGVCLYYLTFFCKQATDGFSIARIHSELNYNPLWETSVLNEKEEWFLNEALSQKFTYLSCGGQSFVFSSEDDKYVIKFFKHRIRKPYSFFMRVPLPEGLDKRRQHRYEKDLFKFTRDFNSYKLAFEKLREETGLVYIHLNKGSDLNRTLSIVDKLGIEHKIPLDDFEFVVQKKGQPVCTHMQCLMQQGDTEGAKKALQMILSSIVQRCEKGVFDEDPRIQYNFGFMGDRPIFIDVGRFVNDPARKDPEVYRGDLEHIAERFGQWLGKEFPSLVPVLEEELKIYIEPDSSSGSSFQSFSQGI